MTKDTVQVIAANTVAISLTIDNINSVLTTISLCLAIGYTIYKFFENKK